MSWGPPAAERSNYKRYFATFICTRCKQRRHLLGGGFQMLPPNPLTGATRRLCEPCVSERAALRAAEVFA